MSNLSNEKTKDIMLNLYPNKPSPVQPHHIQPQHIQQTTKPFPSRESYVSQPFKKESVSSKKWYISIVIACISILLFSPFTLNFLDEMCASKNIEAFDKRGDPKLVLMILLFVFLLMVIRSLLMLL